MVMLYWRHNYVCSATYEKAELYVITSIFDRNSIILTKMLLYIIYAVCFEEFIEDYMRQLMGFLLLVYECFQVCSSSNITCWIKGVKSIVRKCTLSILGHNVGYVWKCSLFLLCVMFIIILQEKYMFMDLHLLFLVCWLSLCAFLARTVIMKWHYIFIRFNFKLLEHNFGT